MTAAFESPRQSDLAAAASAMTVKAAAMRAAFAGAWPPTMIGIGVVLTVAWFGSLLWLLVRMILAVV
jgi:hypothetical protein